MNPMSMVPYGDKRVPAGILAILVGGLGIHKMYMGYWKQGLIMLAISLAAGWVTFGIAPALMWLVGVIEGIRYLTSSNSDFYYRYQVNKNPWF